jgi:hypothetical protein
MGFAHVMYFHHDGIRDAEDSDEKWDELRSELGEAVLKLCLDPDERMIPPGKKERVTSEEVGRHSNAANFCDKPHSTEQEVYAWSGNRLAKLGDLSDDEFRGILQQVMIEKGRRDL